MRKPVFIKVLLILCACLPGEVSAQKGYEAPDHYLYTYFTAANGLISSEVFSVEKDAQGFLWIGTASGISRFDGYTFSNYSYSALGQVLGTVTCIKSEPSGKIWFGASSGLYCFYKNQVHKVSAEITSPQGVNDLLFEENGSCWMATENGPVFLTADILNAGLKSPVNLENYLLPEWNSKTKTREQRRINLLGKTQEGCLFFASELKLYRDLNKKVSLVYSLEDPAERILSIFPVSNEKIFFDCSRSEMNKLENGIHTIIDLHRQPDSVHLPQTAGWWYLGTEGLYLFHPDTETVSVSISTLEEGVYWPSRMCRDGNMFWVGSHDGIIRLKPTPFKKIDNNQPGLFGEIYSVANLRDGKLLFGANRGKLFSYTDGILNDFFPDHQTLFPHAEVKCLYEDERGWLWAGSGYEGLSVIMNGSIRRFTKKDGLHDNSISAFFHTTHGRFFALGDEGLTEIFMDGAGNIKFNAIHFAPNISRYAGFTAAMEGPDGSLWIGGDEGLFHLVSNKLVAYPLNKKMIPLTAVRQAPDQTYWIATAGEGILHVRFKGNDQLEIMDQYTQADGLSAAHFLDLLIDKEGNIWAASSGGLSFIGLHGKYSRRVLNFNSDDGYLNKGYSSIRLAQDHTGQIWAGSSQGTASFSPQQLFLAEKHPNVILNAVDFLNGSLPVSATDSVLALTNPRFKYNNNAISFSFGAIDFSNQSAVQYYYKMEGLDTGWISCGSLRTATYHSLPPGHYTFVVKASNNKGLWSSQETRFDFTISPPFWQTAWFRILAVLLVGGLVYVFIRRREKHIRDKEKQKTELQALRASNFQYQYEMAQVINYFARSISDQQNTDDLLWDIAKNCIAKLGFEDCVIYLKHPARDTLVQKAAWGAKTSGEDKILNPIEIPFGKGIVGSVAQSGLAEIVNDTTLDSRYIVDDAQRYSEIAVPVLSEGKLIGVIDSENPEKGFYTDRHLQILTTIASLCADRMSKIHAQQLAHEKEKKYSSSAMTWRVHDFQHSGHK
ncbi:MAG: GAF domain-containing protein [Chitinophagaceae bacterium]|nr:GAF domain-containing protein [Chitinophagaceae bacterium]